jgi:hypothetical protein
VLLISDAAFKEIKKGEKKRQLPGNKIRMRQQHLAREIKRQKGGKERRQLAKILLTEPMDQVLLYL